MKKWEKFSDEQLIAFVSESHSFRQLAEKCGYQKDSGSGITIVKQMCLDKSFDTSHFSSKLTKDEVNVEKVFVQGYKSRETLKRNLIALRGHQCECCKLTKWNGKDIPLQVHHKDGDGLNNLLENLQLLCPNCHAQTDTYCGKNKSKSISDDMLIEALKNSENIHQALLKVGSTDGRLYERAYDLLSLDGVSLKEKAEAEKQKSCAMCGNKISKNATYCEKCIHIVQQKTTRPSRDDLKKMIREKSFLAIGREFDVSDNTIRKWCIAYGLPFKRKAIDAYSDDDWELI